MESKRTQKQRGSEYTLMWSEVTTRSTLISHYIRCEDCFLSDSKQFNAKRSKQKIKDLTFKHADYTLTSNHQVLWQRLFPVHFQSIPHAVPNRHCMRTTETFPFEQICKWGSRWHATPVRGGCSHDHLSLKTGRNLWILGEGRASWNTSKIVPLP